MRIERRIYIEAEIKTEPISFADKNHIMVLEAPCDVLGAALPDTRKSFGALGPGMTEGTSGKHLPLVETDELHVTVKVDEIFHPMDEDHSIGWVCLTTEAGCIIRAYLNSDCESVVHFTLEQGDPPVTAYAYYSLHGL